MKQKPRTELKRVGILLAIMAGLFAAADLWYIPMFFRMDDMSWERMFRTESVHHYIMMAFGAWIFGVLPVMVATCSLGAWIIFKHLDKISDESRDTS
jgi:hypothetical protein